MDRDTLLSRYQAVLDAHGAWGTHNVALPYGLFTMGPEPRGDNFRAQKFLQLVADSVPRPLSGLRVLDLGCGEGLYALEFAQHGAEVVAVEGRAASLAKAEFCKEALGLRSVSFVQDDVRAVTRERYGVFDVVICSGILYHLDQPAAFDFLRTVREMCQGLCLVDTRVAETAEVEVVYHGRSYRGSMYREHAPGLTPEEKAKDLGASLDNDHSFWITKHDLANFLADCGFTTVSECLVPVPWMLRSDRVTLVAAAGRPVKAFNALGPEAGERRWPAFWGARREP